MIEDFNQVGPWLTTGYSYLFGTFAKRVSHPPNSTPASVLNLAYPGQIGDEITSVDFEQIETMVIDIFEFAVKHSIQPPAGPDEIAARRETAISDLESAYESAVDVFEFEFTDDSNGSLEWEFGYLFMGNDHSWVIHAYCVWQ